VIVEIGSRRLTAVVEAATVAGWSVHPEPGLPVSVTVRPGREHLFDADSGERRRDP
jgi:multiple sugar transport system ATP-binding protein